MELVTIVRLTIKSKPITLRHIEEMSDYDFWIRPDMANPKFAAVYREKIARWTVISFSLTKNPAFDSRIFLISDLNLSREYRIRITLTSFRKSSKKTSK